MGSDDVEVPESLERTLRQIVEGTAAEAGERFFGELVRHLARAMGTKCAWVTEWLPEERRLRALSFWVGDGFHGDYEYDIAGTPCEPVIESRELCHVPDRVIELFPDDPDLPALGAVSYMGVPLLDTDGSLLGHLALLHDEPMDRDPTAESIFRIFAGRAAAELRRLRRDRELEQGRSERRAAEERIRSLAGETAYLRAEIDSLRGFDEIVGESRALRRVLEEVHKVAASEATVLITGETGTGKELVARAIHRRSRRAEGPLITVNCAAIPENLQESEFFGHEKGAFSGATSRREGRFMLADGGTIFLDEVGELPADLQAKLLRVLQEGEFEPVGSSRTQHVDVRVISATNRDLEDLVEQGDFRRDLLYRLNVFPIHLPPLRERDDDVVLLAETFVDRIARRDGRPIPSLNVEAKARLRRYDWPGNVRELQNVVERAVIVSPDPDRLDLERALPETAAGSASAAPPRPGEITTAGRPGEIGPPGQPGEILTETELRDLERDNMRRALEDSDWKVSGEGGAAERLGLNPNTLRSRMKAFGLRRPESRLDS